VPQVAAACGGVGLPDAGGLDRLPVAGAVLSAKCASSGRPNGTASDHGIVVACLPWVRADRTADPPGACGPCPTAHRGTSSDPEAIGIPNSGRTVGPSASTTPTRLTLKPKRRQGPSAARVREMGLAGILALGKAEKGCRVAPAGRPAGPYRL